ncbi:MAG: hypothetical protein TU35_004070 [Thermoproteus sp. AZ2]|uniref:Uncharacterized protein n=1 Tax=Thermoproteus sp. AZ2 TaxID=1609232 RepID=A0ACC6V028_9CREN
MPFNVPVTILVPQSPHVDVFANKLPTSVEALGGTTVYQWSLFVANNATLTVTYRIKSFGSFGAVTLPNIEAIADVDLGGYISQANETINTLNNTYIYLENLTYGINIFINSLNNFTNNLNNLKTILNISSTAFREGAVGLNSSQYVIYALNSQLSALSSSLIGVAQTLNRSLLLVQYEYGYLVTLANTLQTQADAIAAYEKSLNTTTSALSADIQDLETVYNNLQIIKNNLYSIQNQLYNIKNKINNIKTNNTYILNATNALGQELDDAIAATSSAISMVDSAQSSVGALINILANTRSALISIGGQLYQVGALLNQTASSTRTNASAFLNQTPAVILNASRSLAEIANNLTKLNAQLAGYISAIEKGADLLNSEAQSLASTIPEIDALLSSIRQEQAALGLANSIFSNYLYNITNTINNYKLYESIVKNYENIYNSTNIRYTFVLEMPTAVNQGELNINVTLTTTNATNYSSSIYLLLLIPIVFILIGLIAFLIK